MATRKNTSNQLARAMRVAAMLSEFPPDIRDAWIKIIHWYARTKPVEG